MPYKDKEKQKVSQNKSYLKNKETVKERSARRKLEGRILVSCIKESNPCKDCEKWYPYYVMQFDHLGDKEFDISKWLTHSLNKEKLFKEIAKCDLVCSNCHAVRSHLRRSE